jgi:dihydropteroate synthase
MRRRLADAPPVNNVRDRSRLDGLRIPVLRIALARAEQRASQLADDIMIAAAEGLNRPSAARLARVLEEELESLVEQIADLRRSLVTCEVAEAA